MTEPASSALSAPSRDARQAYRRQRALVLCLAALSGLAAVFAEGAPTGFAAADVFWRFAFAALVTLAAAYSSAATWIVASGIAAAGAVGGPVALAVVAMADLAASVGAAVLRRRKPLLGALVVGVAVQVLLRLPDIGPNGTTAALAAVAVVPVLVSAYRRVGASQQRFVRRVALFTVAAVALLLIPVAIAAFTAWRNGGTAVAESRAWLDAARQGDQPAVLAHLDAARAAFEDTETATEAWYVAPARALPLVDAQLDAVSTLAGSGHDIVTSARAAAEVADIDELRLQGGRIDVDRLERLRQPMHDTAEVLHRAQADLAALDTTWVLPMVHERVDAFGEQVDDAASDTDLAAASLDVAPYLLGTDAPRRYLVLFTSPAETRELGGFVGNYGELVVDRGEISLSTVGRSGNLNEAMEGLDADGIPVADPAAFPERYLQYEPWVHAQNLTGTPDMPTVTAMTTELYEQATGTAIDGVIYVDPIGLAGLLRLTGAIKVDGYDELLSTDNVAEFLLRDQYVRFPETDERADFLERVSQVTFERLIETDLPGPRFVGESMYDAVAGGHLAIWTVDPIAHPLLERLGLDGALRVPAGDDALLVTNSNANPSKIDAYLHRSTRYDVTYDPATGLVEGTATIELRNDVPEGLSGYVSGNQYDELFGSNRTFVSLYAPLQIDGATLDGEVLPVEVHQEYGLQRSGAFVVIPPRASVSVTFAVRGQVASGPVYRLHWLTPGLANPDHFEVVVRGPNGAVPTMTVTGSMTETVEADRVTLDGLGEAEISARFG